MRILRVAAILLFGFFLLSKFPAYSARQFDFQDPELSKMTIKGTVSNISRMDQKITIASKDDKGGFHLDHSLLTHKIKNRAGLEHFIKHL